MSSINNINTSVLDGIIIGRVEPHIYVFITGTVPNYIKVGDTYRPVGIRLEEWKRHYDDPKKLWDDVAKVDDDTYFRDHAVHKYFIEEEKRERLKKEDLPEGIYYSNEFFRYFDNENAPDVVKKAINFIKESYLRNEGKYSFFKFDESRIPIAHTYERKENYEPRPNQDEAIKNFMSAIDNGRTNLLMYAVMRFGKSFTSMCCATEMEANVVVIVSAKADVEEEWKKTVESHERFEKYVFMNSQNLAEGHTAIKKRLDEGKNVAIFLTLQDLQGTKVKEKHKELFETCIDLLIIDETHFGARGEKYGAVLRELGVKKTSNSNKDPKENDTFFLDDLKESIKALNSRIRLHLSGTPYRILMGDEFKPEDIVAFFQFSDISDAQDKWDEENRYNDKVNEWDNPYFGFPQMVRFAFQPNKSSREKLEELKKSGITYAFSALFHPKSIEKDDEHQSHKIFQHAKEILDLFEVIDGSKSEEGMLSFLDYDKIKEGKMCRHIVCVLPFRASCDALEKLIKDNKEKFKNLNQYEIINIAGLDIDKQYEGKNGARNIKLKIKSCERDNKKTLTLTVNRMLTGSTVEEWDTMLYLKDTASPQEYDQAIFRLQNQYIKTYNGGKEEVIKRNMKPQTLLVDFDPNRMFVMQENKSQIYNVNTDKNSNTQLEERIRKELEISPIVTINKNKIEKVEPTNILDAVREYSKDKSVVDEAKAIPIDFSLLDIEEIRKEIEKQAKLDSKEGLKISPTEGEGTDLDTNDSESKDDKSKDDGTSKLDSTKTANEEDNLRKKFATYYSRILFFAFLTKDHIISLKELIEKIENGENNKRIAKNIGLNIDILKLIQKNINPYISRDLDYKIQNLNTLANDKDVEPIKRVEVAMKKFGRLSESEIVTPEEIADEMVSILPEESITKDTKILDIASKQGEFVYAIYKKYGKSIADNFYSIPTSEVAYEFTRKVYEFLNLDVSHIESQHNSYELIEEEKSMIKEKKIKINKKEVMFDIVIGNPPYQDIGGSGGSNDAPLYQCFADVSEKITTRYVSLIMPSRWFSAGRENLLGKFRSHMLECRNIAIMKCFTNAGEVFPNVEIKGGICYYLYDTKYQDKCKYIIMRDGQTTTVERNLNDFNVLIREPIFSEVVKKVQSKNKGKNVDSIISADTPFGISSNVKGSKKNPIKVYNKSASNHDTRLYHIERAVRMVEYVSRQDIKKNNKYINTYKVFIPGGYGAGESFPHQILGIPEYAPKNSVCSQSYLFAPFKTKIEANNFIKYLKTKFFRALVSSIKISQSAPNRVYRFVPLQDFTNDSDIDWNQSIEEIDKQLYKKYGLNDDEIQFIEKMIKPM